MWAPSIPSTLLANPKSATLTEQSSLIKILAGLRSLCNTSAEWRYLRATKILYVKVEIWINSRWIGDLNNFLRSD